MQQQKTPRFWKVPLEKEKSLKDMLQNIDGMEEAIMGYDNLDIDEITVCLQPAPYIVDKIEEHKDKIFNEFLRLIGVSNLSLQKKERMIRDEIATLQGGSIASRFNRWDSRIKAIQEINDKFNTNIEVEFYDGLPTTHQDINLNVGDEEDVI